MIISTDVWKEFGYGAIIFIAALMGINPELYEAANVDGAGRLQKIWHVTLPGIRVTIVLVATLNIANILNAGFDQIYNLYSPIVYKSGDIIDTYVYRMSFINTPVFPRYGDRPAEIGDQLHHDCNCPRPGKEVCQLPHFLKGISLFGLHDLHACLWRADGSKYEKI